MNFDQPPKIEKKQVDRDQAILKFKEIFKSRDGTVDTLYILNSTGPILDSGSGNPDLTKNAIENTRIMLRRIEEFEKEFGVDLGLKKDVISLQAALDSRGNFGAGSKSRELLTKIEKMEDGSFLD